MSREVAVSRAALICEQQRAYFCKQLLFHFSLPASFNSRRPHSDFTGLLQVRLFSSELSPLPSEASIIPTWPIPGPMGSHYPFSAGGSVHQPVRLLFRACNQVLSPDEGTKRLYISSVVLHAWVLKGCWRNSYKHSLVPLQNSHYPTPAGPLLLSRIPSSRAVDSLDYPHSGHSKPFLLPLSSAKMTKPPKPNL